MDRVARSFRLHFVTVRTLSVHPLKVGFNYLSSWATMYQLGFSFQVELATGVVNTLAAADI